MNDNFETKKNFQNLKERFDVFSGIETTQTIKEVFFPKIYGFLNDIERMEQSHKLMTECIRKFDEDISLKSDKS